MKNTGQQRSQHKVGSSRSSVRQLEGRAAFLFISCSPALHKLERPHCICNMQAILALLTYRFARLRTAHGGFTSASSMQKPPMLPLVARSRLHGLDLRTTAHIAHGRVQQRRPRDMMCTWSRLDGVRTSPPLRRGWHLRHVTQRASSAEEVASFQKAIHIHQTNGEPTSAPSGGEPL